MPSAEFLTLRQACGLTQAEASALLGMSQKSIEAWERGRLAVNKAAGDKLRNLDDLIRDRVTLILQPLARGKQQGERVNLIRYRTPESYAAAQPAHAAAGLSMAAYHAMLCRVIDGLARLGVRYSVQWPGDIAEKASAAFDGSGCAQEG